VPPGMATVELRSVPDARPLALAESHKDARSGGKRSRCLHGVGTLEQLDRLCTRYNGRLAAAGVGSVSPARTRRRRQ